MGRASAGRAMPGGPDRGPMPTSPDRGPMPGGIKPMLALLSEMPPDEGAFGFEYKWDGVRAICYHDGTRTRIESRNLKDVTDSFPELEPMPGRLGGRAVVLDGEIIAMGEEGSPSFARLQHRLGVTDRRSAERRSRDNPVSYMLFDVLYLDGAETMSLAYAQRREILEGLGLEGPCWRTPPSNVGEGAAMMEASRANRLEGVMAKRTDSRYSPGQRNGDWLKIKLVDRQEFVIGGWVPMTAGGRGPGSILVGYYDSPPGAGTGAGGRLVYAGKVGSGFSEMDREDLLGVFEEKRRQGSPFAEGKGEKAARYVEPEVVAEVEFRGWTATRRLRQPAYKGLRYDKPAREVILEKPVRF